MSKYIDRIVYKELLAKTAVGKVLILYGPRRVGKTELLKRFVNDQKEGSYLFLNGEDQRTVDAFEDRSASNYIRILGDKKLLIIDEAQAIPNIGKKLKLIVDELSGVKVVASGSSAFDLSHSLGEPLVGRTRRIQLFPLAQMELQEDYLTMVDKREERLLFGGYPELIHYQNWSDKADYLEEIVSSYLLKDILAYEGIRKSDRIMNLLKLLAYQVGQEVSVSELAKSLSGLSRNTVENYLDLLSKVYIIYKVPGFSRNLRKEVTKSDKWYFHDNGIRNAIIRNFNQLSLRNDQGLLWENYLMAERRKYLSYTNRSINMHFWRTYDQQEIDLVEEEKGNLSAFEFKWNAKSKVKAPAAWTKNYQEASYKIINPNNYLDFIS